MKLLGLMAKRWSEIGSRGWFSRTADPTVRLIAAMFIFRERYPPCIELLEWMLANGYSYGLAALQICTSDKYHLLIVTRPLTAI